MRPHELHRKGSCLTPLAPQNDKAIERKAVQKMTSIPHAQSPLGFQRCSMCHVEKPLEEFHKDRSQKSGYRSACKECLSKQEKQNRQRRKRNRKPVQPLSSQRCSVCHIGKAIEEFYPDPYTKSGYRRDCKVCCSIQQRKKKEKAHPIVQLPLFIFSKVCTKCGIEQPIEDFPLYKRRADGHCTVCKQCRNARKRAKTVRKRPLKPLPVNGGKVCGRCQIEKPFTEFHNNRNEKDGHYYICKECVHHKGIVVNGEATRARAKRHYRENKARHRENAQKWVQAHYAEMQDYYGRYYEANREHHKAYAKEWNKANPLKRQESNSRRTARKKASPVIEKIDFAYILERDGMICYICEKPIEPHHKLHFDHVIPLARGGAHTEDNLKATHNVCNCRKRDKLLSEMTPFQRRGLAS